MNKFLCLVVSTLVATAFGQDGAVGSTGAGSNSFVVPMVATICEATCPLFCNAMYTSCNVVPFIGALCENAKTACEKECAATCGCVKKCGPDCDTFEQNCGTLEIPIGKSVFCPVAGLFCDVGCVAGCASSELANVLVQVANQLLVTAQQLVQMCLQQLSAVAGSVAAS